MNGERVLRGFGSCSSEPMLPGFYRDEKTGDLICKAYRLEAKDVADFVKWIEREFGLEMIASIEEKV